MQYKNVRYDFEATRGIQVETVQIDPQHYDSLHSSGLTATTGGQKNFNNALFY